MGLQIELEEPRSFRYGAFRLFIEFFSDLIAKMGR